MRSFVKMVLIPTSIAWLVGLLVAEAYSEQIMDPRKLAAIRAAAPTLIDEEWNEKLKSPALLWYSHSEMPPAFQHARGNGYSETHLLSPFSNISGDPSDAGLPRFSLKAGGNGNEFPWAVSPGGGHLSAGVNSFKGQLLLDMKNFPVLVFQTEREGRYGGGLVIRGGRVKPIYRPQVSQLDPKLKNPNKVWAWLHPEDKAVYVEVITQRIGSFDAAFQVRFKIRQKEDWGELVFRPVKDAEEYADKLAELPSTPMRRAAIEYLRSDIPVKNRNLRSMHPDDVSFNENADAYYLPEVDQEALLHVLDQPFDNVTGDTFYKTNTDPFNNTGKPNLVPPGWRGGFAANDCNNCHRHTNRHVTQFQVGRGWYGRIRGSDGIFSWHPFEPSSVDYNGNERPVRIRRSFLASGRVRVLKQGRGTTYLPKGYSFIDGVY